MALVPHTTTQAAGEKALVLHSGSQQPVRCSGRDNADTHRLRLRQPCCRSCCLAAHAQSALCLCHAAQGHTGDPVKDLEAKLKFIQEHVPTRIQNVSGRSVLVCPLRADATTHTTPAFLLVLTFLCASRALQPSWRGVGRVPSIPHGMVLHFTATHTSSSDV